MRFGVNFTLKDDVLFYLKIFTNSVFCLLWCLKAFIAGIVQKRIAETILMSTHNVSFYTETKKFIN